MVVKKFNKFSIISHSVITIFQYVFWEFVSDKAFISFRYAKNLVVNLELNYNPEFPPLEGYESFLWLIWLTIGFVINFDILLYAKLLGILFCHLSLYILHILAYKLTKNRKFANYITLIFAFTPSISLWSVGGTFHLFYLFILLCSLYLLISDLEHLKPTIYSRSSISFSILCLTHHLSIFIYILTFLFILFYLRSKKRFSNFQILIVSFIYTLPVILIFLPYNLWRFYYFKSFIPYFLTVELVQVQTFFLKNIVYTPIFILLIPSILLFMSYVKKYSHFLFSNKNKVYLFLLLAYYILLALVFDTWQLGYPNLTLVYPLLYLILPPKFNFLIFKNNFKKMDKDFKRKTGVATLLTIILFQISTIYLIYPMIKHYAFGIRGCNGELGHWINKYSDNYTSLATGDIGILSYYADVTVFDISKKSKTHPNLFTGHQNPNFIFDNNITYLILKDPYKDFITNDSRFLTEYDFICHARLLSPKRIIQKEYEYTVYVLKNFDLPYTAKRELIKSSYRFY